VKAKVKLPVGWESFSKFGNPWTYFAGFGGKTLGSRTHRFASESPWNDQFSPLRAKLKRKEKGHEAHCGHVPKLPKLVRSAASGLKLTVECNEVAPATSGITPDYSLTLY